MSVDVNWESCVPTSRSAAVAMSSPRSHRRPDLDEARSAASLADWVTSAIVAKEDRLGQLGPRGLRIKSGADPDFSSPV